MTTLQTILKEWETDSKVDQLHIDRELVRIPSLHSKYLAYHAEFGAKKAAAATNLSAVKHRKRRYYRNEMNRHELDEYGLEPYQGLKPSNSELNDLFDMDPDVRAAKEKVAQIELSVQLIEDIVKQIGFRSNLMRTLVDFIKFREGS